MGAGLPLVAVFVIVLLAYCCWHREVVGKHHFYDQQHFHGQNSIVSVLVLLVPKTFLCADDLDLKHLRIISGMKYNKFTLTHCCKIQLAVVRIEPVVSWLSQSISPLPTML